MSALDQMSFEQYSVERRALSGNPSLIDMGEHNLYGSLSLSFPGRFPMIAPSDDPKAQYRCHVAELFLERWGLPAGEKSRATVCEGVRAALRAIFSMLAAEGKSILIPSDVYPEYLRLAAQSGIRTRFYEARAGAPSMEELAAVDSALVCDPLKPWGGHLGRQESARLAAWAMEKPSERLLIADCAYGMDDVGAGSDWRDGAQALVLSSLSKGWLAPRKAGCAMAPLAWADRVREAIGLMGKSHEGLRQAYACLSSHSKRPAAVALAVAERAADAAEIVGARTEGLSLAGYFFRSKQPASAWLAQGIIAIPCSVFGSGSSESFLSVLAPLHKT